jgi:dihydroorotate dehydrogenase
MQETYRIGHLEVESPWGNAGGVVKRVEDVELMAHTGVGWIEPGSYTIPKRIGNSPNGEVVYYHNPETGETGNALGMPNKGIDIVETEIPEMVEIAEAYGKKLIVNVAPVSEEPAVETQELVTRVLEAGAHGVILNAGCPNVVTSDGGRHEILSTNPKALGLVLNGLRPIVEKYDQRIFIRTSPAVSSKHARDIMLVIRRSGVVGGVFVPNTEPGFMPQNADGTPILEVPGNIGGKSGPATAPDARKQTAWAIKALRNSGIDVVSSGGIMNGKELDMRLKLGAIAGAGTTFFYESAEEGWSEATDRLLREFAEASC